MTIGWQFECQANLGSLEPWIHVVIEQLQVTGNPLSAASFAARIAATSHALRANARRHEKPASTKFSLVHGSSSTVNDCLEHNAREATLCR
ncbi:hypothetical protein IST4116A_05622 [Burkholderia cenocepacia]|nr:hypothetical protein IST4112_05624 [Burkholderia cenocepacia]CAB5110726.1 hypothetical protein IST4113_05632 [Burkholderia cenocepacia]CAB5133365.1 hypothetical protein IST4134_05634 [Burkholderia cenocepacia]CAB5135665.1 hypothetical protein IST4129_05634 [Burkholderia cenocepacia]CAB5137284.1 hypothetical protein IST4116B_05617 [Burkholderia cenocepacia]